MNDRLLSGKDKKQLSRIEILKNKALENLESALLDERYEEAPGLINEAKNLGALQSDIRNVIVQFSGALKVRRRDEANQFNGRRRF